MLFGPPAPQECLIGGQNVRVSLLCGLNYFWPACTCRVSDMRPEFILMELCSAAVLNFRSVESMSFGKQLLLFALAAPPDPAGEAAGDECAAGAARAAPAMPCAGAVSAVVAAGAAVLAPGTAVPRPARAGFSATVLGRTV